MPPKETFEIIIESLGVMFRPSDGPGGNGYCARLVHWDSERQTKLAATGRLGGTIEQAFESLFEVTASMLNQSVELSASHGGEIHIDDGVNHSLVSGRLL